MAGGNNRIDFQVGFSTDESGLKKLQANLTQILEMGKHVDPLKGLTASEQDAINKAKILKDALQKAYSSEIGTTNITKLNNELKKSGTTINECRNSFKNMGAQGANAYNLLGTQILSANVKIKETNKLLDKMAVTFANTIRYGISSSIFNNMTGAVQKAVRYAEDLDESLTAIRIVSGNSADNMAKFAKEANTAAKALGTTTLEYTDASLIYYQQGLNGDEVKERTNVTMEMANVLGQSASEVSDYMTAIWNNFDDGSKSLEYYGDVITALGASTASSAAEISEGLGKFAAVADTVGLSYEYATTALATVVAETRQSADIVGTAFKTLFARIQDLELGKTLDDGTTLGKYSQALQAVGVDIKDQNGQLKDMDAILDDMGSKWQTLSKDQQVALAQTVAGTRQYTQLVALMDSWDTFGKNLQTASNAAGTLTEQNEIYLESTEAKLKTMKATAQGLYDTLIDKDELNDGIDLLTNFISLWDKFLSSFGGGMKSLAGIGVILSSIFSKQLSGEINRIVTNMQKVKDNEQLLQIQKQAAYQPTAPAPETASGQGYAAANEAQTQNAQRILEIYSAIGQEERNNLVTLQNEITLLAEKVAKEEFILNEKAQAAVADMANVDHQLEYLGFLNAQGDELEKGLALLSSQDEILTNEITLKQESINISNAEVECLQRELNIAETVRELEANQNTATASALQEVKMRIQAKQEELGLSDDMVKYLTNENKTAKDIYKAFERILEIKKKNVQEDNEEVKELQAELKAAKELLKLEQDRRDINKNKEEKDDKQDKFDKAAMAAQQAGVISGSMDILTGSLATVSTGWMQLNSIVDIWNNKDMSTGDKLAQTFMNLSMTLPMILMSIDKVKKGFTTLQTAMEGYLLMQELNVASINKENAAELIRTGTQSKALKALLANYAVKKGLLTVEEAQEALNETGIVLENIKIAGLWGEVGVTKALAAAKLFLQSIDLKSLLIKAAIAAAIGIAIALHKQEAKAIKENAEAQQEAADKAREVAEASREAYDSAKDLADEYEKLKDAGTSSFTDLKQSAYELFMQYGDTEGAIESMRATTVSELDAIVAKFLEAKGKIAGEKTKESKDASMDSYKASLVDATLEEGGTVRDVDSGREMIDIGAGRASGKTEEFYDELTNYGVKIDYVNNKIDSEDFAEAYLTYRDEIDALLTDENYRGLSEVMKLRSILDRVKDEADQYTEENDLFNELEAENYANEYLDKFTVNSVDSYIQATNDLYRYYHDVLHMSAEEAELYAQQYLTTSAKSVDDILEIASKAALKKSLNVNEEQLQGLERLSEAQVAYLSKYKDLFEQSGMTVSEFVNTDSAKGAIKVEDLKLKQANLGTTAGGKKEEERYTREELKSAGISEDYSVQNLGSQWSEAAYELAGYNKELEEAKKNQTRLAQQNLDTWTSENEEKYNEDLEKINEQLENFNELSVESSSKKDQFIESLENNDISIAPFFTEEENVNAAYFNEQMASFRQMFESYKEANGPEYTFEDFIDEEGIRQQYGQLLEALDNTPPLTVEVYLQNEGFTTDDTDLLKDADKVKEALDAMNSGNAEGLAEDTQKIVEMFDKLSENEGFKEQIDNLKKLKAGTKEYETTLAQLTAQLSNAQSIETNWKTTLETAQKAIKAQSKELDGMQSAYKNLNSIVTEYNEMGFLSTDSLQQLIEMDDRYVNCLINENGQLALNKEAFVELTKAKYENMAADIALETLSFMKAAAEGKQLDEDQLERLNTMTELTTATWDEIDGLHEEARALLNNSYILGKYTAKQREAMEAMIEASEKRTKFLKQSADKTNVSTLDKSISAKNNKSSSEKKDKEHMKENIDAYHQWEQQIKACENALSELQERQGHLKGKQLLKNIQAQTIALKEQAAAQERLNAQYRAEAAALRGVLAAKGAAFDGSGNISNYSALLQQAQDKYNATVDAYNKKKTDANEKAVDNAKKEYDNLKDAIGDYEKALEGMQKAQQAMNELMQKQADIALAELETKWEIEFQMDTHKAQRQLSDFINNLNDDFRKSFTDWKKEFKNAKDNFFNDGIQEDIFNQIKKIEEIQNFMDDTKSRSIDEYTQHMIDTMTNPAGFDPTKEGEYTFSEGDIFTSASDASEYLVQLGDQLKDLADELKSAYETAWEAYLEGINQAIEETDRLNNIIDKNIDKLEQYRKIQQLSLTGADSTKNSLEFNKTLAKQYEAQVQGFMTQKEKLESLLATTGVKLRKDATGAIDESSVDVLNMNEDQKIIYEQILNYQDKILDTTVKRVENEREILDLETKQTMNDLATQMFGSSDVDYLKQQWEDALKWEERYYDGYEQIYQIEQLGKKYDDLKHKELSLKAQEKINKAKAVELEELSKSENLSKDELAIAEKRLEVVQAEIALEEAQNNKNSMKLTRDETGNWSYQYVANEDDVAAKEQDLIDKTNEYYEKSKEAYQNGVEYAFEVWDTYSKKIIEIQQDSTISEEERQIRIQAVTDQMLKGFMTASTDVSKFQVDLATSAALLSKRVIEQNQIDIDNLSGIALAAAQASNDARVSDLQTTRGEMKNEESGMLDDMKEYLKDGAEFFDTTVSNGVSMWQEKESEITNSILNASNTVQTKISEYQYKVRDYAKAIGLDLGNVSKSYDEVANSTDTAKEAVRNYINEQTSKLMGVKSEIDRIKAAWDIVATACKNAASSMQSYIGQTQAAIRESNSLAESARKAASEIEKMNSTKNSNKSNSTDKGDKKYRAEWMGGTYADTRFNIYEGNKKVAITGVPNTAFKNCKTDEDYSKAAKQWLLNNSKYAGNISFKTGGYTGEWSNGSVENNGRLAMLHQKELILNAKDTENMLDMVTMVREMQSASGAIDKAIINSIANMIGAITGVKVQSVGNTNSNNKNTSNTFNITAEFPNANDVNEIREAILSLPNLAQQYLSINTL